MQRVMIVTNSLTGGGAERSMNLVCNELNKRGWLVSLVPINSGNPDQIVPTCEVFPLHRPWQGGFKDTILAIWRFNRVVNKWNPQIIVLNCDLPELFGAFLFSHRILVTVEHINRPWITRINLGKIVRGLLRVRRSKWIAVSSHLKIWPQGIAPDAILMNAISPEISRSPEIKDFDATYILKRLVFLGRLNPQKRPEWAVALSAQLGLPLVVIGDGLMREGLEREAREKRLEVTFLGQVREPWLSILSGDLLVIPSAFEGDGLVVVEAMQLRLPILVADIPDFRRFNLPERNYCPNLDGFLTQILNHENDLSQLVIPQGIAKLILSQRSLETVGNAWEVFLRGLPQAS